MKSRTFLFIFLIIALFAFTANTFATETVKQEVKQDKKVTTTEAQTVTVEFNASTCVDAKDIKDCTPAEKAACEKAAKDGDKGAQKCVTVCVPSTSCCPK